jgi:hypothetical protein
MVTTRVTTSFTSVRTEADRIGTAGVSTLTPRLTGPTHSPTLAPNTLLVCDPAIHTGGHSYDGVPGVLEQKTSTLCN